MTASGPPTGPAEAVLARAAWQPLLLAPCPRRLDLLRLTPAWPTLPRTVRVHRNHAFEVVSSVWGPFCAAAGLDVTAVPGPYDDSLATTAPGGGSPADLDLVSLDFERYRTAMSEPQLLAWLVERLTSLAESGTAPVLVTNWPAADAEAFNAELGRAVEQLPGVVVADVAALARELGADFLDPARSALAGTPWSAAAAVAVARAFGLRWLPALWCPPVKAVVVDLDGTLYDGVLGEDGPAGVRLTDAHARLQEELVELRARGVFLGVVSRNEPDDVDALFAQRTEFPLRRDMISAAAVSWGSKADGIAGIAAQLRIDSAAVALLDDNPGELATVAAEHPGVRALHAADPELARQALVHCPGLFRFSSTGDDARRVDDLAAAGRRAVDLRAAEDPDAYLRSLQVQLQVRVDSPDDLARVAQLSERTNQFSTALLRIDEGELARRHRAGELSFAAVSLRDRLSDSGIVAAVLASCSDRRLTVEGVSISCRALGRRIETAMVEAAIAALAHDDVDELEFAYATGPRNRPALDWLAGYARGDLGSSGSAVVDWDARSAASRAARRPVSVIVVGEGRHDER